MCTCGDAHVEMLARAVPQEVVVDVLRRRALLKLLLADGEHELLDHAVAQLRRGDGGRRTLGELVG